MTSHTNLVLKECVKCKKVKSLDLFSKNNRAKDKRDNRCKSCYLAYYQKNRVEFLEQKRVYHHSYEGYKKVLYKSIVGRLKYKEDYKNKKLFFTKEQFANWLKDNEETYKSLWSNWRGSNYKRNLAPSIDRIDTKGHYRLDNIQLLTVKENCIKDCPKRKITKDTAQQIRDIYKDWDSTQIILANKFGISQQQLSKIVNNHVWI